MYIGKVKVNGNWSKLEDLIQEQITGQSDFAFHAANTYQFQCEGKYGVRFCNAASQPSDAKAGERLLGVQTAQYKPEEGTCLYVCAVQDLPPAAVYLKISQIGA